MMPPSLFGVGGFFIPLDLYYIIETYEEIVYEPNSN